MSKAIDRKEPIDVIFGTVSKAALSGPLSDLWPKQATDRPMAEPIVFTIENDYVIDPNFDYRTVLPTIRENRYENLAPEEAIEFILDLIGHYEEQITKLETTLGKPHEKWTKSDLPFLEAQFEEELDAPEDPDYLSFRMSAICSQYNAGIMILDALGTERAAELGLHLVEGDYPGSSFCGVAFDGDIEELNLELVTRGLNLRVEQSE